MTMCNKSKKSVSMMLFVTLSAVVMLTGGSPARADMASYPPDYRGQPNSVHVIFDINSDAQGVWTTTLFETVSCGYPLYSTPPSASDDGLDVTVFVPNFIDSLPLKHFRMQLFYDGPVDRNDISFSAVAGGGLYHSVGSSSGPGIYTEHYFDLDINPNPQWEEIVLFGNVEGNVLPGNLYRVEIDTISLPEPATLSVSLIGGLMLLKRKVISRRL